MNTPRNIFRGASIFDPQPRESVIPYNAKSLTNLVTQRWERGTGRAYPVPHIFARQSHAYYARFGASIIVRLISPRRLIRDHISRSAGAGGSTRERGIVSTLFFFLSFLSENAPGRSATVIANAVVDPARDYAPAGRNSGNEQKKNSSRRPSSIISHVILEHAGFLMPRH